jgi:hypothetical protein
VQFERCPYDSSPISVRSLGDRLEISCDACGGAWEIRGSLIHRLRSPDAATLRAVRERLFPASVLACGNETVAIESVRNAAG